MTTITFDTHVFAKEQARFGEDKLVTKNDLIESGVTGSSAGVIRRQFTPMSSRRLPSMQP